MSKRPHVVPGAGGLARCRTARGRPHPQQPATTSGLAVGEGAPALLLPGLCLAIALALLAGCSTPIGADRTSSRRAYRDTSASALAGRMSDASRLVLHRFDLGRSFDRNPPAALKALHERACADTRRDLLYALAELNYLHAEDLHRSVKPGAPRTAPDFFLASAIYAWLYLLGEGPEPPPDPFDRRFRVACDLYNRAVARGFSTGSRSNAVVRLEGGVRDLAPGPVTVDFDATASTAQWKLENVEAILPADEFVVRGLTVRDRPSGLGAPLILVGKALEHRRFPQRFPATLLLRATGGLPDWQAGELRVTLELQSPYERETVEVAGRTIPLEGDTTAPLAHTLNDSRVWALGSAQFFSAEERVKSAIYLTQPYERGKIPVVFVHGTFSSPVWWAEMWNTLRADPVLRERFQFWNFIYNSGNPVTFSAANLRDAIQAKLAQFDPAGTDPGLRQMVVIGHSQGGLLTKLCVTDTGDRLWQAVSPKPFDALTFKTPEDREALRRNAFFTPLPCVKRVVFISTPHRGSYLATSFVRNLARLFMTLPNETVKVTRGLLEARGEEVVPSKIRKHIPTSLDSMSPRNPGLLALAEIPVAPGVKAHSIIAVRGDDPPGRGGDGVVKYGSAHVDYADSELIVRSGHSCQGKPAVIEEVRRILLEHCGGAPAPAR